MLLGNIPSTHKTLNSYIILKDMNEFSFVCFWNTLHGSMELDHISHNSPRISSFLLLLGCWCLAHNRSIAGTLKVFKGCSTELIQVFLSVSSRMIFVDRFSICRDGIRCYLCSSSMKVWCVWCRRNFCELFCSNASGLGMDHMNWGAAISWFLDLGIHTRRLMQVWCCGSFCELFCSAASGLGMDHMNWGAVISWLLDGEIPRWGFFGRGIPIFWFFGGFQLVNAMLVW